MDLNSNQTTPRQRLFTAIPLPVAVQQQMLPLAPRPQRRVQPVAAAQLHLTLSFIGQGLVAEIDPLLSACMGQCSIPAPFDLRISGLGKFGSNRRGTLLWAGIAEQPALLQLQAQLATALQPCLPAKDQRAYRPHITLARCKPHIPASVLENFLQQSTPEDLCFRVDGFGLYSSLTTPSGAIYQCEKSYSLA